MAERVLRILAIDDEELNLRAFASLFCRHFPGAVVRTESSGEGGLAAVREMDPDLVLLDARMPDPDGFEVCRRIKTDPQTAHVPVLMVSGAFIETHHRISGFEGGADGYICKPFKNEELLAQMRALMDGVNGKKASFRVLVVDNSRTSRQVIMAEVKKNPYTEIAVFESVAVALAAIDAVKPDLVFCEAEMPGADGLSFCRALRGKERYRETPFVLLCKAVDNDLTRTASAAGVTDAFTKPLTPGRIQAYVDRHVQTMQERFDHDVLIVEGSVGVRKVLREVLSGMRVRVREAEGAKEAAESLQRHPADLIVMGDRLNDIPGPQWCAELRATDEQRWVPILGLSEENGRGVAFIKAGADDYLSRELIREEIEIRVRNLLKRVSLTRQLSTAVERERALNEHKNRLLGMAAHDIRSPVAAISHFAELLLESSLEDRDFVRARLVSVRDIARHALGIVNSVLDVKSVQSGVVEFRSEAFRLDELVHERLVFMNEIGRGRNVQGGFVNRVPEGDAALVHGDRDRLAQVLDNLFSNAVKYCTDGSQYVVSVSREVEGWLVEVQDNGPGIPRDELFGVFDEFGRTSVKSSGGEKSTGLGLAITKKLVELHGGTIWIESKVGQGTKVSFVLPAPSPQEPADGKEQS